MFYSPKEAVKDLSSSKQARDKRGKDSRAPPQRLQILEDRKHWKTHPLPTFTVPLPRTKGQGTKGVVLDKSFRLSSLLFESESELSRVRLFVTSWTVAHQAPPSMEFSRQEYWSGLPFPSPGDLPNPGIKPRSPHCRQMLYHLSQ